MDAVFVCAGCVWPRAAVVPLCTQLRAVSALALANETRARNAEARLLAAKSTTAAAEAAASPRKKVRVYIDGCFDMMHFGHWCVRVWASLSLPSGGVAWLQHRTGVTYFCMPRICLVVVLASNALRQALAAGDELVVGLINDEEIMLNKGSPPIMPMEERLIAVQACKFVHEVIPYVPWRGM